jgi:hypothetical protein
MFMKNLQYFIVQIIIFINMNFEKQKIKRIELNLFEFNTVLKVC